MSSLTRLGGDSSSLQTQGLTFASVHDSYWTHASSIDQMSSIIRETFIALHSSDVLSRLLNEVRYASSVSCHRIAYEFLVPRALCRLQSPSRILGNFADTQAAGHP
jgi:hypothetical protein